MPDAYAVSDPIYQFLVTSLVGQRVPSALHAARELANSNDLDWQLVWTVAERERVSPLLYRAARQAELLPEWLLERCHQAYVETGMHNVLRFHETSQVLDALHQAGIDVIVLKGLALAEDIYGNVALRPMLDVDLLVRRDAVQDALATLEMCGYQRTLPDLAPDSSLEYENEMFLWKHDRLEWHLELHWNLFNSPLYQQLMTEDHLWSSTRSLKIDVAQANSLSHEMQLLHLCGHLALHHRWQGLLWWNDIATFTSQKSSEIQWDSMLEMALETGLVIPLQTVVRELANRWQAGIPDAVVEKVQRLTPLPDELRHLDRIADINRPPARRLLDDLAELPDHARRLHFARQNLFPSAAYMDVRYNIRHPFMRPAYYVRRWLMGFIGLITQARSGSMTDE